MTGRMTNGRQSGLGTRPDARSIKRGDFLLLIQVFGGRWKNLMYRFSTLVSTLLSGFWVAL